MNQAAPSGAAFLCPESFSAGAPEFCTPLSCEAEFFDKIEAFTLFFKLVCDNISGMADDGMDRNRAFEDLSYIRSVMNRVRRRNIIDGVYYMIWGLVIPVCAVTTWILGGLEIFEWIWLTWTAGCVLGAVCSFLVGWFRAKQAPPPEPGSPTALYYASWIAFGVTAAVALGVGWGSGMLTVPQGLFVLGMLLTCTYVVDAAFSGLVLLYVMAAGWLVTGVVSLFLPVRLASFFFGLATFVLEFIPGLFLTRIYRREVRGKV